MHLNLQRRVWVAASAASVLAVSAFATPASAAVYLIDHNTIEPAPNGDQGPGGRWNRYAAPADINGGFIYDAAGSLTTITYSKTGIITDSSNAGTTAIFDNVANPNPSWATSSTDNGSSGDYFFTTNASTPTADSYTVTFSGLTSGNTISIDVLASRNTGSPRGFYEYSVDGGATWAGFTVLNSDGTAATASPWNTSNTQTAVFHNVNDGYTAHRYMNTTGQTLVGTTVSVRVTDEAVSGNYSVINAIRLTAVPEPGSVGLLLAGAVLGLRARRRR